MDELKLKIISPEKTLFQGSVYLVQLPGSEGVFSILGNHAPLIASLKKGDVVYQTAQNTESKSISINSGFVEVNKNVVTVCAE